VFVSAPEQRRPEQPTMARLRPALTPVSLLIVLLVFYLLVQIKVIIFLLLFAVLFATVIERPVIRLEARGMPRAMGILTVYAAILMGIVGLALLFVPLLTQEAREFSQEAPAIIDDLAEDWRTSDNQFLAKTGYRLLTQLKFRLENPPPPTGETAIGLLTGVGAAIFGVVATFVIGFYYLMEKNLIKRLLLAQLVPDTQERINAIWNDVESKVGGWLRGQLILCVIIGVSAGCFYGLIGLRFWLLLAVFAGITEIVPIIGPWIGGIPAFAIALLDSWQKAIAVAVFLMLLQLVENSILVPRVMKGAIGLSPLTVFLAVLAGTEFMGLIGALLAIPFAAALQVIVGDVLRTRRERFAHEHATGPVQASGSWRTVLTQFLGEGESHRAHSPPADPSEPAQPAESSTPVETGPVHGSS
jgi:predicted PurR-regulated permease PerM